jgi:hypothetical protein
MEPKTALASLIPRGAFRMPGPGELGPLPPTGGRHIERCEVYFWNVAAVANRELRGAVFIFPRRSKDDRPHPGRKTQQVLNARLLALMKGDQFLLVPMS